MHRADLEARIFGALRERILVPDVVLYAAQRALELVQEGLTLRDPSIDRKRLDELDLEFTNLARFAARTGRVDEAVDLFRELEQERGEIVGRLDARGSTDVDLEALRPWIVDRVEKMRSAFETEPENVREALRTLLGTRRLRVGPDPDRGFRVEGLFVLPLEMRAPWGQKTARACDSVVAGALRHNRTDPNRYQAPAWIGDARCVAKPRPARVRLGAARSAGQSNPRLKRQSPSDSDRLCRGQVFRQCSSSLAAPFGRWRAS